MATVITTTLPINGSRNFTAVIQIDGTTAAGEASLTPVIDPKAAIANVQAAAGMTGLPANFKVKRISSDLGGFSASLFWDATTPILAAALGQYVDELEFFDSGAPLINTAGTGVTGKLLLSTKGLAAGMTGTIIIQGYH